MINVQFPLSNAPLIKLTENLGIQNSFSMIAASSSPDQSGKNLLRLLHGGPSKFAEQSQRNFISSSPARLRPPRFCMPPGCNSNARKSIGSQSTSGSCYSDNLTSQTAAALSVAHNKKMASSSSLTLLAKHNTKASVSPSLSAPSVGKLLLEMLKQNSSGDSSTCSSLNIVSTAITPEANKDYDTQSGMAQQILLSSILSHDTNGATESIKGGINRKGIIKENDCYSVTFDQYYNVSGKEGRDFITKNRLFNSSNSFVNASNYSDGSRIQKSVRALPRLDLLTSFTDIPQNVPSKSWASQNHCSGSTHSSPYMLSTNRSSGNKQRVADALKKDNSYYHSKPTPSSISSTSSLFSDSFSLCALSSASTQTTFTSCGMAKNFRADKIISMQHKFANPLYMRSPEPNAIPFPSWGRSSVTAAMV